MLSKNQKKRIDQYLSGFAEFRESTQYESIRKDTERKEKKFQDLTEGEIEELTEFEFGELITELWSTDIWGNKDFQIQRILDENGLGILREELKYLFYGEDDIGRRYERFLDKVKYLGPASVTEMLCSFNPNNFGIWNDKAREGLKALGFGDRLPLDTYKITGEQYEKFLKVLSEIKKYLQEKGYQNPNLMLVDHLLFSIEPEKPGDEPKEKEDFSHDEVRDQLRDIGSWLGFEPDTEVKIARGAQVDTVWRAKIGNLGIVNYVFEVHKNGSIDSLILNLQRANRNPTVQKIIAVSDQEQLDKIKGEMESLPSDFRENIVFWPAREVRTVHRKLSDTSEIIEKLGLAKSGFEMD